MVSAPIFPLTTGAIYYATEARGYGLVLGFSALALLSWQYAAEGRNRRLALAGLALGLTGAVSSHYYAVLVLAPLGVGELVRTVWSRRLDLPVWAALTTPVLPLLLFLPVIRSAQAYSPTFWGAPQWRQTLDYYPFLFRPSLNLFVALAALGFLYLHFVPVPAPDPSPKRFRVPPHETAALLAFGVLPLLSVAAAKFVTNGYHERYVLASAIGFTGLIVGGCFFVFQGRRAAGTLLVVLFFAGFSVGWLQNFVNLRRESPTCNAPRNSSNTIRRHQFPSCLPKALVSTGSPFTPRRIWPGVVPTPRIRMLRSAT